MVTPTAMGYNDHQYQNNETNTIKNSLFSHNLSPTLSPTTIAIATMAPSTEAPLPLSPSSPRPHNQQLPSSRFLSSFSLFSIHSLCLYLYLFFSFFFFERSQIQKKVSNLFKLSLPFFFLLWEAKYGKISLYSFKLPLSFYIFRIISINFEKPNLEK